jgi:NAD+-dependent protein deacetylase SIR2
MLLYGEANPNDTEFGAISLRDLRKGPDAVIIAGTSLKIPGARRLAREFCRAAKTRKGGVTIWINKELPSLDKDFEGLLDYIVWGDCDAAASMFSVSLGH